MQEMQLLADLKHPGVVTIIDGNVSDEGQPWLVLDYINGPHIDTYCFSKQLGIKEVVNLVINLCDTLHFIHQRGVYHKDLKPGNVLVKQINGVPHPVLIDFGIAMVADDEVELNYGTRGFSSPEQVAGEKVDQRSDLYSMGVLLGFLLLQALGMEKESGDLSGLSSALKQSDVPKDLQKVVFQLTAKEKQKRYQSAEEVRSDLNQWLLGYPLSFDNHKISAVLKKTVNRHPWVTTALVLALVLVVFFTGKYTRDIQNLQQLTVAEKNATDELMNFMLDDLYENLERIGRIDVLRSVAEKSVAHLSKQDPMTLDHVGHFQTAKAYTNTGRVFDYLEQSEQAKKMFSQATVNLLAAKEKQGSEAVYLELLAKLRVYESQVLSSLGQEQSTEEVLTEAIDALEQLAVIDPDYDRQTLWEARLELSYHLMEYAQTDRASEQVLKTVQLANEQLQLNSDDADWNYAKSHSMQMKAWYELDFGEIEQGIKDTQAAIEFAYNSIKGDQEDLKKHHNLRILHNQLAYFYMETDEIDRAKTAVLKAIELGDNLKLKAPFNQEFEREQAYSFSTAGEIFQTQGQTEQALTFYQQGLAISKRNYEQDSENFSAANDLAVDSLLVADLLQQTGEQVAANEIFNAVEALMEPIHLAEPNNKYYSHALLVTKLQLQKIDEAKGLFDLVVKNDMVDGVIESLLVKHELVWLP